MAATRLTIARLAGVSVATVDRVIRNDPAVKPETCERVQAALDSLRKTRVGRGRPPKHTSIRVAFVLPVIQSRFVDKVERDIALSGSFFREHRITPSFHRYDFANKRDAEDAMKSLLAYDAIVVLPLDYPWIDQLIAECTESDVPVVTIFSDQPASQRKAFLGADNRMMGRTAGLLMGRFTAGRSASVLILSGSLRLYDQSERRTGFEQILEEDFKNLRWHVEPDFPASDDEAYAVLLAALPRFDDLAGIYVTCDGAEGAVRAVREAKLVPPIVVIGHGLSEVTRSMLADGQIDVVLDQDVRAVVHAAGLAARDLVNEVRGSATLAQQPIRIYLRENATM
jgi:LacI family transcriptional regulator